ncbi:MAG: SPASM domain-containing protein [Lentisphaeria bacterium]|nr:SPASM domain-containing protein [Lentisphaeria bacterium]
MTKRFKHIYFELTNICDRKCSFCPEVKREKLFMPYDDAEKFLVQSAEISEAVYFHLQGEPLLHPDFEKITTFAKKIGLILKLTTNASHLQKYSEYLLEGNFFQINFSIQSLNEVSNDERLRVLDDIANFTRKALQKCPDMYINFRWWQNSPPDVEFFAQKFNIPTEKWLPYSGRHSVNITGRLYSTFDRQFVWPSSDADKRTDGTCGSCRGLLDHCGILCDGRVVPCCLDHEGFLTLGDLHSGNLSDILNSPRAAAIADGFKNNKRIETLCQNCNFAQRFNRK